MSLGQVAIRGFREAGTRVRTTLLPALAKHWDWALLVAVLLLAFRRLFESLPYLWFSADTYYAHGALVPIFSGIVVAERWKDLRRLPLKGSWWPLIPIAPLLYVEWLAVRTTLYDLQAVLFLATLCLGVLVIAGWRWLRGLAAPIGFLAFGLPVFDGFIDANTQSAQALSTDSSFALLRLVGLQPRLIDRTIIAMPHYSMDVGVPCSGMKILLAVVASSVFFVLVANLKPWRSAILLALALPLALIVNALRIALIGVVGNEWGTTVAGRFHDYSGYISLGVCLGLQYVATRALGWK